MLNIKKKKKNKDLPFTKKCKASNITMCSLKSISVFQSCERGYSSVTPVTNLFLENVIPFNPSVTPLITPW